MHIWLDVGQACLQRSLKLINQSQAKNVNDTRRLCTCAVLDRIAFFVASSSCNRAW